MTDIVDPANIAAAAQKVGEAHAHFNECLAGLNDVQYEVSHSSPLTGGYGETGAYREALRDFQGAFDNVLSEFLDEEFEFVKFLAGFAERINQAAGLYQSNELRTGEQLSAISRTLEEGA